MKGEHVLFDTIRSSSALTTRTVRGSGPVRQRALRPGEHHEQLKGVNALVPLYVLVSNWAYMVIAALDEYQVVSLQMHRKNDRSESSAWSSGRAATASS